MRFGRRMAFVKVSAGGYDPLLGEHVEGKETEDIVPCNLSALTIEKSMELFGEVNKDIVVARLLRPYKMPFDFVRIDGKKYNVRRESVYRKGVLYLEGTQSGIKRNG